MATLVIGAGFKLIGNLAEQLPDERVVVIEHPQVIEARNLHDKSRCHPTITALLAGDFVHEFDPRDLVSLIPAGIEIDRVLPATDESSVVGAAYVAEELRLPGSGTRAAEIFQDKLGLREAAHAAGLPNPRWRAVASLAELRAAATELACDGLVLKPTRRSGSQGVVLLDRGDDLAAAWRHTTTAQGRLRIDPPPSTRYLVEERLHGSEVSVECLVADGEVIFLNVTDKRVLHGRFPVEIGHVVPAVLGQDTGKELRDLMQALVEATGLGTGMLHCEWILTADGPVLVECAARLPGDRITDLIALAYDAPVMARYADLMVRRATAGPAKPVAAAVMPDTTVQTSAIRFLTAPATGTVQDVSGLAEAAAAPGVVAATLTVEVGDEVSLPYASRDRIGHVLVTGPDAAEAWRRAEQAAGLVEVTVR